MTIGWRRLAIVGVAVMGTLLIEAFTVGISTEGAFALVGIVGGYCGFDAKIKNGK